MASTLYNRDGLHPSSDSTLVVMAMQNNRSTKSRLGMSWYHKILSMSLNAMQIKAEWSQPVPDLA